jgi:hypothetical protein
LCKYYNSFRHILDYSFLSSLEHKFKISSRNAKLPKIAYCQSREILSKRPTIPIEISQILHISNGSFEKTLFPTATRQKNCSTNMMNKAPLLPALLEDDFGSDEFLQNDGCYPNPGRTGLSKQISRVPRVSLKRRACSWKPSQIRISEGKKARGITTFVVPQLTPERATRCSNENDPSKAPPQTPKNRSPPSLNDWKSNHVLAIKDSVLQQIPKNNQVPNWKMDKGFAMNETPRRILLRPRRTGARTSPPARIPPPFPLLR